MRRKVNHQCAGLDHLLKPCSCWHLLIGLMGRMGWFGEQEKLVMEDTSPMEFFTFDWKLLLAYVICGGWMLTIQQTELWKTWLLFSPARGVSDPIVSGSALQLGLTNKCGSTSSEKLWWVPWRMERLDLGLRTLLLHKGATSHNNYIAVFS